MTRFLTLLALYFVPYWALYRPLQYYRVRPWSMTSEITKVGEETLPEAVQAYFSLHRAALESLGFVAENILAFRYPGGSATTYDHFFSQREQEVSCSLRIRVPDTPTEPSLRYCHFVTNFLDGQRLEVTNTLEFLAWGTSDNEVVYYLDDVQDVASLYALHLHVLATVGTPRSPFLPLGTDLTPHCHEQQAKTNRRLVQEGIVQHDPTTNLYRYTLRGAYRFFLFSESPFKALMELPTRRRAQALQLAHAKNVPKGNVPEE